MKKLLSVILSITLLLCSFALPISASAADYIGTARAKSIALENAGVKASMATVVKNRLDYEDGIRVYDVEFYTSMADYEYEINATTGKIVDKDIDRKFTITLSSNTYKYNGKAKKPSVTAEGKPKKKTIYGKTKKEVKEKLKKLQAEIITGIYVEPSQLTIVHVATSINDNKLNLNIVSDVTYKRNKETIKIIENGTIGAIPIQKLTEAQINDFLSTLTNYTLIQ